MKRENKLQTKDLVMIGIFGALLFVVSIISMTIVGAFSPKLYPFAATIMALLCAPIYFLLVAKVNKSLTSLLSFGIVGMI